MHIYVGTYIHMSIHTKRTLHTTVRIHTLRMIFLLSSWCSGLNDRPSSRSKVRATIICPDLFRILPSYVSTPTYTHRRLWEGMCMCMFMCMWYILLSSDVLPSTYVAIVQVNFLLVLPDVCMEIHVHGRELLRDLPRCAHHLLHIHIQRHILLTVTVTFAIVRT